MSMITASLWVPRGAAAAFPTKYEVDNEELSRISKLAKLHLEDAKEDLLESRNHGGESDRTAEDADSDTDMENGGVTLQGQKQDADDDLKAYDLEHYDDVDEQGDATTSNVATLGNVQSLAYYGNSSEDPYITLNNDQEDEDEREELQILSTDNMVVAAKVEDEVPYLEVYVYEDEADNLYVHHDIMLPAVPLCVEWLDLPVNGIQSVKDKDRQGNYVAVGTMDPDIELWDLDTVDSMYPNAILGQGSEEISSNFSQASKKQKRKKSNPNDEFHVDAVLSLSANRQHRNLMASASADRTIKLWDLNTTICAKSYSYHSDKVCAVEWHPKEATSLLSGGYDRRVHVADMRAAGAKVPTWVVESDVETVRWNSHAPNYFFVTTENGLLHMNDWRSASSDRETNKSVWTLQAHDEAVSSLAVNPVIPGFLATGSSDKEVKLWDCRATGPSMIVSRNLGIGRIFSTNFAPDDEVAFRLAVSGSKGALQIWDTSTNTGVRGAFAGRTGPMQPDEAHERIIGVQEDDSEEEQDEVAEADNAR